jgi:hypothetical protein
VIRRLRTAIELSCGLTEDERSQLKEWILDVLFKKEKSKLGGREEVEKMKAERAAAVNALRAANVSDEIIEKAYPIMR